MILLRSTTLAEPEDRSLTDGAVLDQPAITQADYEALALFRYEIRRFLDFSRQLLDAEGLPPAQYQALLAIQAHRGPMSISDLAHELFIKIQTAVELVARLQDADLVIRTVSPDDRRRILLTLTPHAEQIFPRLAALHLAQLHSKAPSFAAALARFQNAWAVSPR
jgi:DNA-binding MarR family transcriptional regulator